MNIVEEDATYSSCHQEGAETPQILYCYDWSLLVLQGLNLTLFPLQKLQLQPLSKHWLYPPAVNITELPVDQTIRVESAEVLKHILNRRHRQHQHDGDQGNLWLEGLHGRNKVQGRQENEVDIGEAVELLKQILGEEGQEGILGGSDLVALVGLKCFFQILIVCEGRSDGPLPRQVVPVDVER